MAVTTTYPGIYIEELPNSTHTVTAAPTSVAVFVGYSHPFQTKVFNKPVELFSFTDYENTFGGFFSSDYFDAEAALFGNLAQAVNQFFLNGGAIAYVVGLLPATLNQTPSVPGKPLTTPTPITPPSLTIGPLTFTPIQLLDPPASQSANYAGPNHVMQITISNLAATFPASAFSSPPPNLTVPYSYSPEFSSWTDDTADITITYGAPSTSPLAGYGTITETYRQVSAQMTTAKGKPNPNYVATRINYVSDLVMVTVKTPGAPMLPSNGPQQVPGTLSQYPWQGFNSTTAPVIFQANDFIGVFQQDTPLDKLPIFNLLIIPGVTDNLQGSVLSYATAFCERKLAFLIMDPALDDSADGTVPGYPLLIQDTIEGNNVPTESIPQSPNSALYFPYLTTNDPITGLAINPVTTLPYQMPPSGTVAGIFANTDVTRGVWKAPAGLATTLTNVIDVVERGQMTDLRQGVLNPLGVNCIRNFPGTGPVVWGTRTSIAQNTAYQQWWYVPVRRMALFLEQSLYISLGWVVFEPNAQPLWTAIVSEIQAFMLGLYRQGAFQGTTPSQAFQVKCDSTTTTQTDIDNGVVNILVAFAPLKPAEFVVIQIAQLAGQAQS
jgi:uncharacterized protein